MPPSGGAVSEADMVRFPVRLSELSLSFMIRKMFYRPRFVSALLMIPALLSVQGVGFSAISPPQADHAPLVPSAAKSLVVRPVIVKPATSKPGNGKVNAAGKMEAAALLSHASLIVLEADALALADDAPGVPKASVGTSSVPASDTEKRKSIQNELRAAFAQDFVQSIRYNPAKTVLPADEDILDESYIASLNPNSGLLINEDGLVLPHAFDSTDTDAKSAPGSSARKLTASPLSLQTFLRFLEPVQNAMVSSPFGFRWGRPHQGVDLAAPVGSPVVAAETGKVVYSGWKSGYGNFIAIDHGHGMKTHYAHCSRLLVRQGQAVKKGAVIAKVGSTGNSTGPHLHFEVLANGVHRNPTKYLNHTITLQAAR
jgi:murein DD-endopeptidase MepM/ murein hydrolase activator NlpD